ncbi:MAG TPA: hypothetical protein VL358_06620 [Caulobacteraceae bacterium]|nr:hypothetical protein [Caulobacteraceae bacterium]
MPAPDEEKLLRAFDFFAFPIALASLANWDSRGRQLRHRIDNAVEAVRDALSPQGLHKEALDHVKQRINRLSEQEPFLLPPRNFHASEMLRISDLFREVRSGRRPWTDRFAELPLKACNSEIYPRLGSEKTSHLFQDHREVLFPVAHMTAHHGPTREIETEGNEAESSEIMLTLQSLYRFGAPLPNGFHHDAVRERGEAFREFPFECSRAGETLVSGEYANIYPDDFIRVGKPHKK